MGYFACPDENGKIIQVGEVPDGEEANQEAGIPVSELPNPETQYISGGEIAPRPSMALEVSGACISRIPAPCTCTVNGNVYEVDEETLEFESPCPGKYELKFEKWPYQTEVVTVEVAPCSK